VRIGNTRFNPIECRRHNCVACHWQQQYRCQCRIGNKRRNSIDISTALLLLISERSEPPPFSAESAKHTSPGRSLRSKRRPGVAMHRIEKAL
jgi:hypothetical protein